MKKFPVAARLSFPVTRHASPVTLNAHTESFIVEKSLPAERLDAFLR